MHELRSVGLLASAARPLADLQSSAARARARSVTCGQAGLRELRWWRLGWGATDGLIHQTQGPSLSPASPTARRATCAPEAIIAPPAGGRANTGVASTSTRGPNPLLSLVCRRMASRLALGQGDHRAGGTRAEGLGAAHGRRGRADR